MLKWRDLKALHLLAVASGIVTTEVHGVVRGSAALQSLSQLTDRAASFISHSAEASSATAIERLRYTARPVLACRNFTR